MAERRLSRTRYSVARSLRSISSTVSPGVNSCGRMSGRPPRNRMRRRMASACWVSSSISWPMRSNRRSRPYRKKDREERKDERAERKDIREEGAAVRADANASLKEAAERITLMRDVEARRNGDMDKVQREIDRNAREKQLIDSQIELVKKRKELAKELEQ